MPSMKNSPTTPIVDKLKANRYDISEAKEYPLTPAEVERRVKQAPDTAFFEIVSATEFVRPYFDWDYEVEEPEKFEELKTQLKREAEQDIINLGLPLDAVRWAERHGYKPPKDRFERDVLNKKGTLKISYRAFLKGYKTTKKTLDERVKQYKKNYPQTFLDNKVYSRDRKMGLVFSIKEHDEATGYTDPRRLTTIGHYPHEYTIINCVEDDATIYGHDTFDCEQEPQSPQSTLVELSSDEESAGEYPETNGFELIPQLKQHGFTGIRFISDYNFNCDQLKPGVKCPCCGKDHTSNKYFVWRPALGYAFVKNHSDECQELCIQNGKECLFDIPQPEQPQEEEERPQHSSNFLKTHKLSKANYQIYLDMRDEFENKRQVAMIEKPKPKYIVDDEEIMNKQDLIELFQDYQVPTKKGLKAFTDIWLKDEWKRKFRYMDFIPKNCPSHTYNLWRGYEIQSDKYKDVDETQGDIEPFLKIVNALTNNTPDYLLKTLAFMFQNPDKKTRVAMVFRSAEGVGKNTLFQFIGDIMGNNLYYECSEPEHDLFGNYTTAFERRKLICIDEADVFRYDRQIKPMITNPKTRVRRMYCDAGEINNLTQIIITTNSTCPIKISPSDRRYVVFGGNTDLKGDTEFWRHFYDEWSKKPCNRLAVFKYLMNQNLFGWNADTSRPRTQAYAEIRMMSLAPELRFMSYFITDAFQNTLAPRGALIKAHHLWRIYCEFNPRADVDSRGVSSFGTKLKKFFVDEGVYSEGSLPQAEWNVFHKTRDEFSVKWSIDRQKAYEWLKEKQYTQHTEAFEDLPRPMSYASRDGFSDFEPRQIINTF